TATGRLSPRSFSTLSLSIPFLRICSKRMVVPSSHSRQRQIMKFKIQVQRLRGHNHRHGQLDRFFGIGRYRHVPAPNDLLSAAVSTASAVLQLPAVFIGPFQTVPNGLHDAVPTIVGKFGGAIDGDLVVKTIAGFFDTAD